MYPKGQTSPYSKVPAGGDPRQTEGWALIEAARRMKEAQREPVDREALLAAVRLNWRLWTIIQASLAAPDSSVPDEIKRNLLSLSNFIDRYSVGIISDPKPGKLDTLIRVNREIAAGQFDDSKPEPAVVANRAGPAETATRPLDRTA
ncbi:MAG: flagellar biosynthesis regulator FlaF [Pseudomonadota bacterium]